MRQLDDKGGAFALFRIDGDLATMEADYFLGEGHPDAMAFDGALAGTSIELR